jgi:phosphohistidine phosphatase SixA
MIFIRKVMGRAKKKIDFKSRKKKKYYVKIKRSRPFLFTRFIYLARHAEKADPNNNDTPISQAGWERARQLRDYFANRSLGLINVSTFLRTQQTAEPIATDKGLTTRIFKQTDPNNTRGLMVIEFEHYTSGNILTVGHTNSIPELIWEFCDIDIGTIPENEYDNLYVIGITKSKSKRLFCYKYGVPSK